jgi:hypothetical protein
MKKDIFLIGKVEIVSLLASLFLVSLVIFPFITDKVFPQDNLHWNQTNCTILGLRKDKIKITSVDINLDSSRHNNFNIPIMNDELIVRFSYKINNVEYFSGYIHPENEYYHHAYKTWINRFQIGQQVSCYFPPNNPSRAVLLTKYEKNDFNYWALLGFIPFYLITFFVLYPILNSIQNPVDKKSVGQK